MRAVVIDRLLSEHELPRAIAPSSHPEPTLAAGQLGVLVQAGTHPEREPKRVDEIFEALFALHADGRIRPLISARYPLEQVSQALAALASRRSHGKLVLEPQRSGT